MTLGVDLASRPERTAICAMEWSQGRAILRVLAVGDHDGTPLHDKFLITTIRGLRQIGQGELPIAKTAIDAPFGWPEPFTRALAAWEGGSHWPSGMDNARTEFLWRRTDKFIAEHYKKTPLSVSADKIAVVAMRCAVILTDIAVHHGASASDRRGAGMVCETYPDPAIRYWTRGDSRCLTPRERYKGAEFGRRRRDIACIIQERLELQDPGQLLSQCKASDHALDALASAMIARAVLLGLTVPPEPHEAIMREGWIHVPNAPLDALLGA